jgi:beta-carotene 3-hydroxylase
MTSFLIFLCVFLYIECVTRRAHKYLMFGSMWYFHADHHQRKYANVFERNDMFFYNFCIAKYGAF